jgi:hypothetical protein
MSRGLARASLGALLIGATLLGCSSQPSGRAALFATINAASRIRIYEGLPHPQKETTLFEQERQKPGLLKIDYDYYPTSHEVLDQDARALKAIFLRADSFKLHEPTKCDFHPDYRIEWTAGGVNYSCLLCFGCNEVLVGSPSAGSQCSMAGETGGQLWSLLKAYQKSRPQPLPRPSPADGS